ncbi:MAG: homoserine kinase [Mucinivorans sp.]
MKAVTVFAPATVANIACGFDAMGFAFEGIGDIVRMTLTSDSQIKYINLSGVNLPEKNEDNLMTPALYAIMDAAGERRGVEVKILQKIIPGSGIGSSAAAAVAAVYAYNALLGNIFNDTELVNFALEGEKLASGSTHADNVAPCLMGGVVLIRDYHPLDLVRLENKAPIFVAVVHPHFEVRTKDARAVLPHEMALQSAIRQWANVGALVAGMLHGDAALVGRSLHDNVAEPYRKGFIPKYDELKDAIMAHGALGANISGSGPSVFALCDSIAVATDVCRVMEEHFEKLSIEADVYASPICQHGCRVL